MTHTTKLIFFILGAAIISTMAIIPVQAAPSHYGVQQTFTLGDAGKWDYTDVDQVRHRLYLTRGDRVQVLQLPSGKVIGQISNTAGVHGVAFAQDLKFGFTSNGASNSISVFDLDTLKIKQEIKISGSNPDAIFYEPASHHLYTFNGKSATVTVIDTANMKEIATIAVNGRPEFAVSDQAGKIFVNIVDKAEINVIDVASNKVLDHWPLQGCEEPTGLAIDVKNARLFSVCKNKVMAVTDAKTGRAIMQVAIGEHPDAAIYDATTATVFSSNGDAGGTLTVIHQQSADQYAVQEQLVTLQGAKTMAMDRSSNALYLPALKDKVFSVLVVAPK